MGIWIGIDGGGTKTKFLAIDEQGNKIATHLTGGTYYHVDGIDNVCQRICEGIEAVKCGHEILGICFGMPGFGEGGAADDEAIARIRAAIGPYPFHVVNDVEVGWAGSLALQPGVNIVAGTGSIAFGKNSNGESARSGGWMEFFSDEGSGYWLGRRGLELYAKQSDGRLPRDKFYDMLKEHLALEDDNDLNNLARDVYAPSREKTASIQRILFAAAKAGDASAIHLYEEAGQELALIADAVIRTLKFADVPMISYSGGIFATGELIMKPFQNAMKEQATFTEPALGPEEGAVLLAAEAFTPNAVPTLRKALLKWE